MSVPAAQDIVFGPFTLRMSDRRLTRDGMPLMVGSRALEVLAALAGSAGETVDKNVLFERAWPGLTVGENNLQVQISALRRALGDGWIVTIPGRGYRLMAGAETARADLPPPLTPPVALPDRPSIAVLPFINLSGDPAQEYFSDGVADDIITELSRDRALFVIARNSSFSFRGRSLDVKQIGQELGVHYLVEGSVRRSDNRIRLAVQLVDAISGGHIWAERFDRAVEDVFVVQDEIAASIAAAIRPAVGVAEQRRALRKPPDSLSAWEEYQRGLWHLAKNTPEDTALARVHFQSAASIDPGLTSAFVGLVVTQVSDVFFHALRPAVEAGALMEAAARQAVEADPTDADAVTSLAWAFLIGGNPRACLTHAERALSLNRNSALGHCLKGAALAYLGHGSEGRAEMLLSLRLNPRDATSPYVLSVIANSYYFDRDYAACAETARRSLELFPTFHPPRRILAAALAQLGQSVEAAAILRDLKARAPKLIDIVIRERLPFFRPEDHEHMLQGLRAAGWQD